MALDFPKSPSKESLGAHHGLAAREPFIRLVLFLIVELLAEIARFRLRATLAPTFFWGGLALFVTTAWAFDAHQRFAFRGKLLRRGLASAVLRFGAVSMGCVEVFMAMRIWAPILAPVGWALVEFFKFALARQLIWGASDGSQERRA